MCFLCEERSLLRQVADACKRGVLDHSYMALALYLALPHSTSIRQRVMCNVDRVYYYIELYARGHKVMTVHTNQVSILTAERQHRIVFQSLERCAQGCMGHVDIWRPRRQGPCDTWKHILFANPQHRAYARELLLDVVHGRGHLVRSVAEVLPVRLLPELVASYARPSMEDIIDESRRPPPPREHKPTLLDRWVKRHKTNQC